MSSNGDLIGLPPSSGVLQSHEEVVDPLKWLLRYQRRPVDCMFLNVHPPRTWQPLLTKEVVPPLEDCGIRSDIRQQDSVLLGSWRRSVATSILSCVLSPQNSFYHVSLNWLTIAKPEKRYQLALSIHPVTSNNIFIMPFIWITFVLKKLYNSKSWMFFFLLKRKGNVKTIVTCKHLSSM